MTSQGIPSRGIPAKPAYPGRRVPGAPVGRAVHGTSADWPMGCQNWMVSAGEAGGFVSGGSPPAGAAAESGSGRSAPGKRPPTVAQHGGLLRRRADQIGQFPGDPRDHRAAFLPGKLAAGAQPGGDLLHPPRRARRRPVITVSVAPPAACTRRAVRTSLPTARGQHPESAG